MKVEEDKTRRMNIVATREGCVRVKKSRGNRLESLQAQGLERRESGKTASVFVPSGS